MKTALFAEKTALFAAIAKVYFSINKYSDCSQIDSFLGTSQDQRQKEYSTVRRSTVEWSVPRVNV